MTDRRYDIFNPTIHCIEYQVFVVVVLSLYGLEERQQQNYQTFYLSIHFNLLLFFNSKSKFIYPCHQQGTERH